MRRVIITLTILIAANISKAQDIGGDYYVAPVGHTYSDMGEASDSNDGSYAKPFATWQKAFETAKAGDIVYFRGGVYEPKQTTFQSVITIIDPDQHYRPGTSYGHNGTAENPICYYSYPGEKPILDCRHVRNYGNYLAGISIQYAHHIKFKGLEIKNIYQWKPGVWAQGVTIGGCSNISFENCTVHDVGGRGIIAGSVAGYFGIHTDTLKFVNVDVYNCADTLASTPFNMGDGIKGDAEAGGVFYLEGCRFWNCSDDGVDISGSGQKILKNVWCFNIGTKYAHIYAPDDGNGFKLGGARDTASHANFIMENCISAGNYRYALHMLDYQPYYRNNGRVYNTIFYKNEDGPASFDNPNKPWQDTEFYNCISYDNNRRAMAVAGYEYPHSNNSWIFNLEGSFAWRENTDYVISDDDFVSLDISELSAPRKADGSLPDVNFFKLREGSDLIDGGTKTTLSGENIGIPYSGSSPDVGVFEYTDKGLPIANFIIDNELPYSAIKTLQFNSSKSSDDIKIITYSWDFGDGNKNSLANPSHSYQSGGNYKVSLVVTDGDGNTGTHTEVIEVLGDNPKAHFYLAPTKPTINTETVFNAHPSVDDKGIVSYDWDYGDGNTGKGIFEPYTYKTPGEYRVALLVTDGDGNTDTYNMDIRVRSEVPDANMVVNPHPGETGQTITFDASTSTDDVGIVRYTWNFGDGNGAEGVKATHVYQEAKTYSVQLVAYDEDGQYNATDIGLVINQGAGSNNPPTPLFTYSPENVVLGQGVDFNASGSSDDGSITDYIWDFGDGNTGTGVNTSHTYNQTGDYTVDLSVSDNDGNTATTSKTITVIERFLEILNFGPNPTTGLVSIDYYSPIDQNVSVNAYYIDGSEVTSHMHSANKGQNNKTEIDLTGKNIGEYTITINDGKTTESIKVDLIEVTPPTGNILEIINSTQSTYDIFEINYFVPESGDVLFEVFNSIGNLVVSKTESCIKGNNNLNLSLIGLNAGEYRVSLYDGATSLDTYVTLLVADIVEFKILSGLPNPTVDLFAIEFTYPHSKSITFTVKNEIGKISLIETYQTSKGKNKAVINLSNLPAGNYTIEVSDQHSKLPINVTKQSFFQ